MTAAAESSSKERSSGLEGRVAFVTGGTRGIGAAIGMRLASDGASVAAGYSRDRETAERWAEETAKCDVPVSLHQGNVGSAEDCRRTVQEVLDEHGRLDILINNAGITIDRTMLKMDDEDWYRVLAVNLSGAFFLSKAVLPHYLERGSGRIINISSIVGEMGNIGQANYAASKSGLFGLTKTIARESASQLERSGRRDPDGPGVTVNTVTPGFIATEMLEGIPDKVMDRITSQIPLGRLGRPEEVARVVHFLASDESSYITGQIWAVNGGMDM
ncbi:MAG: 3-oxoacyl-ACP reductase FabG [Actinobacteria bacterium]|nr:3-oxoacyl-ACP reductase FabG [Actinomycetota bacterium]